MSRRPLPVPRSPGLSWLLLLVGASGFAAVWVLLALYTDLQNSWMAVIGALDVALMLRLGHWQPGPRRAALGVTATGLMVLLANWGITSSQIGASLGLDPWQSATKLGLHHAWTLAQLANGITDAVWVALALVAAALASR